MEGVRGFPKTAHYRRIYRPTSSEEADYYVVDEGVQPHQSHPSLPPLNFYPVFSVHDICLLCLIECEMVSR
jgi:hypothetical protein